MSRSTRLGRLAVASIASISIGAASVLPLAAQAQTSAINIASQPLGAALNDLASQAGIVIIAPTELVDGIDAPEIRNATTYEAALDQLLKGTGLHVTRSANGSFVLASDAPAGARPPGQSTAVERASTNDELAAMVDTVFVTGSRIARGDAFSSAGPIQIVDNAQIAQSGFTNIDDVLLRSPAVGVGLGSSATWRNGDAGAAFVNLRGLGVNRSLVLVNGRRRVSGSNLSSAVDLNTIPADMIERVEIITGGASAIYGADAVSGVLNVITRKDIDGLEITSRGGISSRGDAANGSVSLFGGTPFADDDKGSIQIGAVYSKQDGLRALDRSFGHKNLRFLANPANTGPRDGIPDNITIDTRYPYMTPDVNFYIANTIYVANEQGVRPVDLGRVIRPGGLAFTEGGEGSSQTEYLHLRMPVETASVRSQLSYELHPSTRFTFEGELTKTWAHYNDDFSRYDERGSWLSGRGGPEIQLGNPFLPEALRALMTATGLTQVTARKQSIDELGYRQTFHDRTMLALVAGLEGAFANDWKWNVFYQYGEYSDDIQSTNRLIASRYTAANDVITDPVTGQPRCRSAEARAAGCVPYNIFHRAPLTEAQRKYMVHTRLQSAVNTQQVYGGQLTGWLFDLPAGEVKFAVGVEGREEGLKTEDDYLTLAGEGDHSDTQPRLPIDQTFRVHEGFGELVVPVLAGVPFVERLELEAAARFSDYSTIGSTVAYRAGLNWSVSPDLRLRVSRARSVRAPNLNELYSPPVLQLLSIVEPCDATRISANPRREANCRALGVPVGFRESQTGSFVVSRGNSELSEETSDSFTVGAVVTPGWLGGLQLSLDYWRVEIEDAVSSFNPNDIVDRCFDSASLGNVFCDRLTYYSDWNIQEINVSSMNIGQSTAEGIDLGVRYTHDIQHYGAFSVALLGTYLLKREDLVVSNDPRTLIIKDGEYTDPELRANLTLRYEWRRWNGSVELRHIAASDIDRQASPEQYDISRVPSRTYTDLLVGREISDRLAVTLGLNNVFDVNPPATPYTFLGGATTETPGSAVYYDTLGRFFHVSIKSRF